MANTLSSAKRSRQERRRQDRNLLFKSKTRAALKKAVGEITKKKPDTDTAKKAYLLAVSLLDKAGARRMLPPNRAARKVARLTALARKTSPDIFKK